MNEKYGTTIDGIEWEIDLEKEGLVNVEDSKLARKLSKIEVRHLRELIKKNEAGSWYYNWKRGHVREEGQGSILGIKRRVLKEEILRLDEKFISDIKIN